MEPLEIKLKLDRTQAKEAAAAHIADMKRVEDATVRTATAQSKSFNDVAAGFMATEDAKTKAASTGDRQRTASAGQAATAQRSFASVLQETMERSSTAGANAFGKITAKMNIALMGLAALKDLASGFGKAMDDAANKAKRLSDQFSDDRDKLAELATVMGERSDNAFTTRQAKYNQTTGFRPDEGLSFRLQLRNSGEQFRGKTLSDGEFGQFEEQAGQLVAAKGFDPSNSGDLAGSLAGFKDRSGMGANASEDALGKLNSGLSILGRGKGRNSVLVNQFSMLASASLNEDELKGVFTDSDEVATAISVMAEKHDAQAAEMVRAANRGLRDFDGKAGDLLKRAGITAKTKFADSIKAITPLVEQEAREKGIKTEDVLRGHFEDILTREAIGTAINRGVSGGVFADREAYAASVQGPAPAMASIKDYQASDRGRARRADATVKLAESNRGAEFSEVDTLRKQALAKLIEDKQIDTTSTNIQDFVKDKVTFGLLGSGERSRIDNKLESMLVTQYPELLKGRMSVDMPSSIEGSNDLFTRQIGQMRAAGREPFARIEGRDAQNAVVAGQPNAAELVKLTVETNRKLDQLISQGRTGSRPGQATPQLPSQVIPGPRRPMTR